MELAEEEETCAAAAAAAGLPHGEQQAEEKEKSEGGGGEGERRRGAGCAYWLVGRDRACHQPAAAGELLCPSHLGVVGGRPRIPCPLDPNQVAQHVAKCPAAKRRSAVESMPFFSRNINLPSANSASPPLPPALAAAAAAAAPPAGGDGLPQVDARGGVHPSEEREQEEEAEEDRQEAQEPQQKKRRRRKQQAPSLFASMQADQLESLVAIVRAGHARYCGEPLETVMLRHPPCEAHFTPTKGACSVKHMTQQSSILAHMAAAGLLIDGACYVEFGAGKGNLSDLVHECCPRASHILVDRQAVRHKAERRFVWGEGTSQVFTRLNVDIAHLNLGQVPQLQTASSLVSMAKHICGSASDLTIRCSATTLGQHDDKLVGMAVALCCHHRCTYDAYLNKEFLTSVGIGEKEYGVLCRMTSWAVCGFPEEEAKTPAADVREEAVPAAQAQAPSLLSRAEKEAVGTQCKELLDVGRALWLRQRGFDVRLVRYVAPDVSPENTLLIAKRAPSASLA